MNDLVKEVFVAIRANTAATVTEAETAARAAIRAVAEWLNEQSMNSAVPGASSEYMVARSLTETLQAKEAGE